MTKVNINDLKDLILQRAMWHKSNGNLSEMNALLEVVQEILPELEQEEQAKEKQLLEDMEEYYRTRDAERSLMNDSSLNEDSESY